MSRISHLCASLGRSFPIIVMERSVRSRHPGRKAIRGRTAGLRSKITLCIHDVGARESGADPPAGPNRETITQTRPV